MQWYGHDEARACETTMTGTPIEPYLGHERNPTWTDMSGYLVHFTDSYKNLEGILAERLVRPSGPNGWGRRVAEVKEAHMSACFSEIPLSHVGRLTARHGQWGIGFSKAFVTSRGGARVWYLESGGPQGTSLFAAINSLLKAQDFKSELWNLTPFIDGMTPDQYGYRFDWEREWRVPRGLSFIPSNVAFAVAPDPTSGQVLHDKHGLHGLFANAQFRRVDYLEEQFHAAYTPASRDEIPFDQETGEWIEIVPIVDLPDAISNMDVDEDDECRAELKERLSSISDEWLSRERLLWDSS